MIITQIIVIIQIMISTQIMIITRIIIITQIIIINDNYTNHDNCGEALNYNAQYGVDALRSRLLQGWPIIKISL